MAKAWLNDIGLSQYSQAFQNHLVDGRMLNSLMKRDLEKHLNVSKKFHQVSILLGIELLYQVNFSREVRIIRGGAGAGLPHNPSPHPISVQPFTHPHTDPSIHSLIHPSIYPPNHSLIYPPIHTSTHLFTHPSLHLPAHPLPIYTPIYPPTHCPSIQPFTHPPIYLTHSQSTLHLSTYTLSIPLTPIHPSTHIHIPSSIHSPIPSSNISSSLPLLATPYLSRQEPMIRSGDRGNPQPQNPLLLRENH